MTTITIKDLDTCVDLDAQKMAETKGGWGNLMALVHQLDQQYAHNLATTHSAANVANMWYRGVRQIRRGGYYGFVNPGIYGVRRW